LEIYNEQAIDLLTDYSENLMIVEDPQRGIIVQDITEYSVKEPNQILKYIYEGNKRRTVGQTGIKYFI
jgi:Kinesin motor domain